MNIALKLYGVGNAEGAPAEWIKDRQWLGESTNLPAGFDVVETIDQIKAREDAHMVAYNAWISSRKIHAIDSGWEATFSDYKVARTQMYIEMTTKGGFSLLTPSEQEIASRWFIVSDTDRDTVHSLDQQDSFGVIHHARSVKAREKRYTHALVTCFNRLNIDDAKSIERELKQIPTGTLVKKGVDDRLTEKVEISNMVDSYINAGIEGTLEDNGRVGLFDYVLSRATTPFATTGLSVKTFTVKGMTGCAELATKVHDILANGNN